MTYRVNTKLQFNEAGEIKASYQQMLIICLCILGVSSLAYFLAQIL